MQFYYGGTYCKSRDFGMRTELWTKFFRISEIRSPFYRWKPGILRQIFGRFMSINIVSATSYRDWSDLSFLNLICVRILVISEFLKKQACIPIISFLVFLFPRVLHSAIFSFHSLFVSCSLLYQMPSDHYPAISSESFSMLSRFISMDGWTYLFRVILTLACPKISLRLLMSNPSSMHLVANVWRRAW